MKPIVLTKLDQKIVSTMFYSMSKITKNISEDIDQHKKDIYPMDNPLWGWETKTDDKRYQLRLELIQIPDNEVNIPMINIPVSLLEDIRHELVTLNGLANFFVSSSSNCLIFSQFFHIRTPTLEAKMIISHSLRVFLITILATPDLASFLSKKSLNLISSTKKSAP